MSIERTIPITLTRAQWNELCVLLAAEAAKIRDRGPDGARGWLTDARLNACERVLAAATN